MYAPWQPLEKNGRELAQITRYQLDGHHESASATLRGRALSFHHTECKEWHHEYEIRRKGPCETGPIHVLSDEEDLTNASPTPPQGQRLLWEAWIRGLRTVGTDRRHRTSR